MASPFETPVKRKLISSPLKSPTKKDILVGYVLDISAISTGDAPYFNLQFQTGEENVVKMRGYNTKMHKTLSGFQKSGDKVKMEVRRNENNYVTFGSYCQAFKAPSGDVTFPLNISLRESIATGKISRDITIEELKSVDPVQNSETFNLTVKVYLGPNELEDITTSIGQSKIKRDIIIQDSTGQFPMQLFETKLKLFQDGNYYQIKHCLLKKLRGDIFVGLNSDSVITSSAPIPNLSKVTTFIDVTSATVDGFDSIKDITLHYNCTSCKKPIVYGGGKESWIRCSNSECNADIRVNKKLTLHATCTVQFDGEDGEVWARIFPGVMDRLIENVKSVEQVEQYLKSMENFQVYYRDNAVKDIKFVDEAQKEIEKDAEAQKEKDKDAEAQKEKDKDAEAQKEKDKDNGAQKEKDKDNEEQEDNWED